ncbi:hypothetical protein H0H81_007974, partial [Sphagnurus paluster]
MILEEEEADNEDDNNDSDDDDDDDDDDGPPDNDPEPSSGTAEEPEPNAPQSATRPRYIFFFVGVCVGALVNWVRNHYGTFIHSGIVSLRRFVRSRAFLALNRFKKGLSRTVRHTIAALRNVKMVAGIVTHKAVNLKEHLVLVASAPQRITATKESFDGLVTWSHGAFNNIVKDSYRIVEQLGGELERTMLVEPLLFAMHDLPERRHWNTVNRTATVAQVSLVAEASAVRRIEKTAPTSLLWPAAFIAMAEPLDSRRNDSIIP